MQWTKLSVFINIFVTSLSVSLYYCSASEDERTAKLGVKECVSHELVAPYQVLYERPGSFICHVKFTILLMPGGNTKITGIELPTGQFVSEGKTLHADTAAVLATEMKKKKKRSNKKKSATDEDTEDA